MLLLPDLAGCVGNSANVGLWMPFPGLVPVSHSHAPARRRSDPPDEIDAEDIARKLKDGDIVFVTMPWDKTYRFRVYRVQAAEFAGRGHNDAKYRVRYADIRELVVERRRGDATELRHYVVRG